MSFTNFFSRKDFISPFDFIDQFSIHHTQKISIYFYLAENIFISTNAFSIKLIKLIKFNLN